MRWVWLQNVPQSNVRQWRYCRYTRTASMHNTTTLARMRFLSMKGKLRAAVPQREVGNGSSKVNEQDIRVKHRRAEEESWNEPGKTLKRAMRMGYLPCVEATVVRPAFWELLFAVTFDFEV